MATLVLRREHWQALVETLTIDVETAGFLIAGRAAGEDPTLLVRDIYWIPEGGYLRRERRRLEIPAHSYVPGLTAAANDQAVAVFFHSHPGAPANPSPFDEEVDAGLCEPVLIRTGAGLYASIIIGGEPGSVDFSGRIYKGNQEIEIERIRIVGSDLKLLSRNRDAIGSSEVFDRQIRAFGEAGQKALAGLHIGVVGAGGTGSAVSELLIRHGVGQLTVIDDDLISASNLTRIHESAQEDVAKAKVDLISDVAQRIGFGTRVNAVRGRITDQEVFSALRRCDFVFGCTDDNQGRAIMSRFAYWYLTPVLDTAFMVDTAAGRVRGLFGRLTYLAPGAPCLFCRGRIDQRELMAEALSDEERERLAGEGYVPGLGEADPSVGTYTTLIAAAAVSELLERTFDLSGASRPTELLFRLHDRTVSSISREPQPGHYCVDPNIWGRGDEDPMLGMMWNA